MSNETTTTEGNKLIAEFMGYDPTGREVYDTENAEFPFYRKGTWDDVEYDTSWDWLMPVVEKINMNSMGANIDYVRDVISLPICSDISKVYSAVIQFIQWYNENKN